MKTLLALIAAVFAPVCLVTGWYLFGQFSMFPADDPYIWVRTKGVLLICVAIVAAHVFVLGLPAFALLRWRNAVRWWSSIGAGFALAAAPIALWTWPLKYEGMSATSNGVQTMVNGVPTPAGWVQYIQGVVFLGACGALSGLVFWLVWRGKRKQPILCAGA